MPDLTMCRQWRCVHCRNCLRFRATPNDKWQSYFAPDPPGEADCERLVPVLDGGIYGWLRYVRVRLEDQLTGWRVEVRKHDTLPIIVARVAKDLGAGRGSVTMSRRFAMDGLRRSAQFRVGVFVSQAQDELARIERG